VRVLLVAPPGAGKGTQGALIATHFGIPHIATGDLLRDHVARGTELGRAVKRHLDEGHLVPDEIVLAIVEEEIVKAKAAGGGYVLDGVPRNIAQARALYETALKLDMTADVALHLQVGDEEVVRRLSGRRMCEGAGEPFPVHIDDLASIVRCQERGGRLAQRDDDRPEVVRQRLAVYHDQTRPLLDFYAKTKLLRRVDASRPPAEVARAVLQLI